MVSQIRDIETIPSNSEIEAFLLEASLIKKYNPKYNVRLTDGKNYLLIKITREEFPKILLSRRDDDKKSVYFGPFPSAGSLRLVLKTIRKIFPYQSVRNHQNRICLYYHLGLCLCPITLDTGEKKLIYRRNIRHIIQFLNGRISTVLKELGKERENYSKAENFEKAAVMQRQIDAIKLVASPFYKPFEFESNSNFKNEIRVKEINELLEYVNKAGVGVKSLSRIECFDISNISGTNAAASMVVFTSGDKDSKYYRRFRIKNPPKIVPNDFAMLAEVIGRRLTHLDSWGTPDLIIVDGGKGQVSAANKVLAQQGIDIPLIGLAKREELIITSDFKILRLARGSNALNLVRRIRDEAHRFAISYHKKLRSKAIFS